MYLIAEKNFTFLYKYYEKFSNVLNNSIKRKYVRVYNVPGQMKLELRDIIHMFFEGHSIGKKMTILKPNVT